MIEHHRRSIRLPEYDYSQPREYFITLVSYGRSSIFGKIDGERVRLSPFGQIAREEWLKTPVIRPEIELGEFVIMPNHFHAIVHIIDDQPVGAYGPTHINGKPRRGTARRAPTTDGAVIFDPHRVPTDSIERFGKPVPGSIPTIIRAFKSAVTKRINELRGTPSTPVWQRNYWEHVICSDEEYATITAYIESNPANWARDKEYIGS
jgi:putative transposase